MISSCNYTNELDLEYVDFEPNWENPKTTKLEHYKYALQYWGNPEYKEYITHFPQKLYSSNEYELCFFPRIMQGSSYFELKMKFQELDLARNFFEEASAGYIKEYHSYNNYRLTGHCKNDFCFDSNFELEYV